MSEGPSDPDLLDLDDLPDTGTVLGAVHPHDPVLRIVDVVRSLGRWAKRTAKARQVEAEERTKEREDIRGLAFKVIGTVVLGALGMTSTVIGAAVYIGVRLERLDAVIRRVDRVEQVIYSVDGTTTASED